MQHLIDTEHNNNVLLKAESYYNQHGHPLPDLALGTQVAGHNPTSKAWENYGIVTITPSILFSYRIWQSADPQVLFAP